MSHYSFPVLGERDVVLCLHEFGAKTTVEQLAKPTYEFVQPLYENLVIDLCGVTRYVLVSWWLAGPLREANFLYRTQKENAKRLTALVDSIYIYTFLAERNYSSLYLLRLMSLNTLNCMMSLYQRLHSSHSFQGC